VHPPSISGIIDDDWYDRASGKYTTAVFDPTTKVTGGLEDDVGSSPHRLLVNAIADEIKMQSPSAKVIGLSWKDRSAILVAGRAADAAYWYDPYTEHWVTRSYYLAKLPGWLEKLNNENRLPNIEVLLGFLWMQKRRL
jgi:hypothetical protein